jgi:hypothetical protein
MDTTELIELVTSNHAAVVAAHAKTEAARAENQKTRKGVSANVTNLEQKMVRGGFTAARQAPRGGARRSSNCPSSKPSSTKARVVSSDSN